MDTETHTIQTADEALTTDRRYFQGGESLSCHEVACGASGRTFFRIKDKGTSRILMSYPGDKEENFLYADLAKALKEAGIPVPCLLAESKENRLLWLEDVGQSNLLDYCLGESTTDESNDPYPQALSILVNIQNLPEHYFSSRHVRTLPPFDKELYEFERNYFLVELWERLPESPSIPHAALDELCQIAHHLLDGPSSWIHRDFQSQNLILNNEHRLHLVDFQGMRRGSCYYDLASLMYDPYTSLTTSKREALSDHYCKLSGRSQEELNHYLPRAAIQRLLQALGAYGKLGLGMQIPFFQRHIVSGFLQLRQACHQCQEVPHFSEWIDFIISEKPWQKVLNVAE